MTSTSLTSRGLAALTVLTTGAAVAHGQVGAPPSTVVVSGARTASPVVTALPNLPGEDVKPLVTPSIGVGLLLPAVQKVRDAVARANDFDTVYLSPYGPSAGGAPQEAIGVFAARKGYQYWMAKDKRVGLAAPVAGEPKSYTEALVFAPGPGGGPIVTYNLASSTTDSFFPYGESFDGPIRVAVGDINGDGVDDIVTGAGAGGGPHVKVFDGVNRNLLSSFYVSDGGGNPRVGRKGGGQSIELVDLDGDGTNEIVTGDEYSAEYTAAGPGGGPHVRVFDASSVLGTGLTGTTPFVLPSIDYQLANFATSGVFLTGGDLDGDGKAELIANPSGDLTITGDNPFLNSNRLLGGVFVGRGPGLASGLTELPALANPFGPDYTGPIVATPAELDETSPGMEIVYTRFGGYVSVPEPGAALGILATLPLLIARRRR